MANELSGLESKSKQEQKYINYVEPLKCGSNSYQTRSCK